MSTAYTLLAASGTYNYVGATSQTGYIFNANTGTYAYAGNPVTFSYSAIIFNAASGTYAYTGEAASFTVGPAAPFFNVSAGTYTYTGGNVSFILGGAFPNVVGLSLQMAEASLQASGALNPATVGYFGNWPIAVIWVQSAAAAGTVMSPGIVVGQNPVAGSQIVTNSPMTLTVIEQPTSVSYPGTNPSINNPVP